MADLQGGQPDAVRALGESSTEPESCTSIRVFRDHSMECLLLRGGEGSRLLAPGIGNASNSMAGTQQA